MSDDNPKTTPDAPKITFEPGQYVTENGDRAFVLHICDPAPSNYRRFKAIGYVEIVTKNGITQQPARWDPDDGRHFEFDGHSLQPKVHDGYIFMDCSDRIRIASKSEAVSHRKASSDIMLIRFRDNGEITYIGKTHAHHQPEKASD